MYASGRRGLGDFSDILSDILSTGEKIYKDSKTPIVTNPAFKLPPSQYPNGVFTFGSGFSSPYTLPLLIGGGVLLLAFLSKKK